MTSGVGVRVRHRLDHGSLCGETICEHDWHRGRLSQVVTAILGARRKDIEIGSQMFGVFWEVCVSEVFGVSFWLFALAGSLAPSFGGNRGVSLIFFTRRWACLLAWRFASPDIIAIYSYTCMYIYNIHIGGEDRFNKLAPCVIRVSGAGLHRETNEPDPPLEVYMCGGLCLVAAVLGRF